MEKVRLANGMKLAPVMTEIIYTKMDH